jgi:hypothetical protein
MMKIEKGIRKSVILKTYQIKVRNNSVSRNIAIDLIFMWIV